jgi:hypothetical protein
MTRTVWSSIALAAVSLPALGQERIVVHPEDNGATVQNPGMGWVLYYFDHHLARYGSRLAETDSLDDFPGISVVYMAVPWAFLEPEEGRYNWSLLDTPAQRWIKRGKQIAFRFPCCEPFYEYATPKWVQDAGATLYRFETSQRTRRWIKESLGQNIPTHCWAPDYSDPVFLEKHGQFLAAAAGRYDGDPHVAFLDVGSFGTWGEGHTSISDGRRYAADIRAKHLDLYASHFKRTLLVAGDDLLKPDAALVERAKTLGMALRDDSVLVGGTRRVAESAEMARHFWPRVPVILEPAHYGMAVRWWDSWGDGRLFLTSIERYHASYAGIHWWPREFLAENRELIARVDRRLGYRLQLVEASWPRRVHTGRSFTISTTWRNAGVAPCYTGGYPAMTLKNDNGTIAAVLVDEGFSVRQLPVGSSGKAETRTQNAQFQLSIRTIEPGTYDVLVSVGSRIGTPQIALPLGDGDGERRYRIGVIDVVTNLRKLLRDKQPKPLGDVQ